jgi:hypothetical protein
MEPRIVYRRKIRFDLRFRLGDRLAPMPGLPEGIEVFETGASSPVSEHLAEVRCMPEQEARWTAAAKAYAGEVSRACAHLMGVHGCRLAEVDLYGGRLAWRPSRRGVKPARSLAGQQEFVRRVAAAAQRYQPVRSEIFVLVADARARRAQEDRRLFEAEERRRAGFDALAARLRWSWEVGDDVVRVRRDDGGRDTRELAAAALTAERDVHWDLAAVAEVEREADFATWWLHVAPGPWRFRKGRPKAITRYVRPQPQPSVTRHATSHHSSYGVGHF